MTITALKTKNGHHLVNVNNEFIAFAAINCIDPRVSLSNLEEWDWATRTWGEKIIELDDTQSCYVIQNIIGQLKRDNSPTFQLVSEMMEIVSSHVRKGYYKLSRNFTSSSQEGDEEFDQMVAKLFKLSEQKKELGNQSFEFGQIKFSSEQMYCGQYNVGVSHSISITSKPEDTKLETYSTMASIQTTDLTDLTDSIERLSGELKKYSSKVSKYSKKRYIVKN